MQLIDSNDPNDRRKASKHYQRMAKIARQANRQAKRRRLWESLVHTPYFTFSDMIFAALNAALLAAGWTYLLIR